MLIYNEIIEEKLFKFKKVCQENSWQNKAVNYWATNSI